MNRLNHGDRIGATTKEEYVNFISSLRDAGITVADGLGKRTYDQFPYIIWDNKKRRITASRILKSDRRDMSTSVTYTKERFLYRAGVTSQFIIGSPLKHTFI